MNRVSKKNKYITNVGTEIFCEKFARISSAENIMSLQSLHFSSTIFSIQLAIPIKKMKTQK